MKVLNLLCAHQHSFEGWFGSEDDFQSQLVRGLVECPMCADKAVQKMPSAPRLNLGIRARRKDSDNADTKVDTDAGARHASAVDSNAIAVQADQHHIQQAAFLKAMRQVMANTEDVGNKFANEVRAMHYGETEARSIRGQASPKETFELLEEGIQVLPLPMLPALKETLQ